MARNTYYCRCRDCKAMKRKGYILGSYTISHMRGGMYSDPNRTLNDGVRFSAYVKFPKWQPGKRYRRNQDITA